MNSFDFKQTDRRLEICIYSRASIFAKTILAFLALISIFSLIGLVVRLLNTDVMDLINIGIGLTIFIIVSIFLGRLFLWNTFGKELLIFEEGNFNRQYDYKLFKSEAESVAGTQLLAKWFTGDEPTKESKDVIDDDLVKANWEKGRLEIWVDEEQFLSPINLAKADLLQLVELINGFYGSENE